MSGIRYAESEQLEDASVMTMLDLLPYKVAYAVAESFMHRYLHSPGQPGIILGFSLD